MLKSFFAWYERHYLINVSIAVGLFILQLVHLVWMFLDVILLKITGHQYYPVSTFWQNLLILVDYTEIPALISASLIYIHELRKRFNWKAVIFLIFLNSQWLHLFWITDEFVIDQFTAATKLVLPIWLAWVAILIDYLEVPVIIDAFRKLIIAIRKKDLTQIKQIFKD